MNLLSIGAAFALIAAVLVVSEVYEYKKHIVDSLATEAKILGTNNTASIVFSDQRTAEEILSSLEDVPTVVQADIYTKDGELFARYSRKGHAVVNPQMPFVYGNHFEGMYMSFSEPILMSGETIGTIYLRSDIKELYLRILAFLTLLLFMGVVSIAIASYLFSRLQKSITGPVFDLAEAMQRVSDHKDYSIKIPAGNIEEIATLAEGFNQMLEQIKKWDHELTLHRRGLEELIAMRTSQWEEANRKLEAELSERKKAEEQLQRYREDLEKLVEERTAQLKNTNDELQHQIIERERMEDELLRARKLESLGILAGGIAHDFNNLLTAILGNISLAKVYSKPEDKLTPRLETAERASLRARDLTQQLLTFSKGGMPVKKVLPIGGLIRESTGFALRGSNVRCEFRIPEDLWPVEADEGQISQVVHNLILNAQQAMPKGGIVRVSCENCTVVSKEDPGAGTMFIRITIEDHGIGIPKEHLHNIFDPYFTTKQKGSGLGLATCYSIVKKHGGNITVESESGKGTRFHVYLPASGGQIAGRNHDDELPFMGSGRILVMDDEELVREVAGEMLNRSGYEVVGVPDGKDAITLFKEAKETGKAFDAIIMDLTVPGGMGGKEAIQKLLEVDPAVKVIVSSGYSNDPIMANYMEYGFAGVVAKPYMIRTLSREVHRVIRNGSISNS